MECDQDMLKGIAGFIWALEILENPGKFLKPWKSLETTGKALEFSY